MNAPIVVQPPGVSLPATAGRLIGTMLQGGSPFFHTYSPGLGVGNIFIGDSSGNFTLASSGGVDPNANIGLGRFTLASLTVGNRNVAIGENALNATTAGDGTVAIGHNAGQLMTTGYRNTHVGFSAGRTITTAYENTTLGAYNFDLATGGVQNVSIGAFSMHAINTGNGNTSVGAYALTSNTSGANNVALGLGAGQTNLSGANNLLIGYQAGASLVSGSGNVCLGNQAGYFETGSNKLYIANSGGTPLIYGDFSSVRVGINNVSPAQALDVNGGMKCNGSVIDFTGLPSADPHVVGRLWKNSSVLTVSAG